MTNLPVQQRTQTVCLIILSVIASGAALFWLKPVIIPFVLAIFFTLCLTPFIDLQIRYLKFPRWLAIITTLLVGIGILALITLMVSSSAGQISERSGIYQQQIQALIDSMVDILPLAQFGINPEDITNSLIGIIPPDTVTGLISSTLGGVMKLLSNGMLVVIFMLFLILGQNSTKKSSGGVWQEIEYRIKKYILAMVLISAGTGFLVGLTLSILGVEFAWIFGLLAFLLNFIPNVGSVIATLLPLPVALLNPELSFIAKILVFALPLAIQFAMGNIVQPKIMGDSLDLHPVTILIALIFFGMIWGIVGMFLATPISAVIKILCQRFDSSKFFAELMAGRLDRLR
ncbi:MAG: AI-2E family transporter [candidate division Zixibacteria bacterium]|nr:AI-2E family transporter [candidate division Zixibacteria bacterium]